MGLSLGLGMQIGVNAAGPVNSIKNGTFDTDTEWTKGVNITITGGHAVFTAVDTGQNLRQSLDAGTYEISYDVLEYSSGGVRVYASTVAGIERSANGSYTDTLTLVADSSLDFRSRSGPSTLKIDNVFVQKL